MAKSYARAIELLNGLQTNVSVLRQLRKKPRMNSDSISEMRRYLLQLGIAQDQIKRLNVIHVAGSKGKGSTCAFVDSILRQKYKTGMFSSPHLLQVRERIRINGIPLQQDKFAMYFFQVYEKLKEPLPTYFRFLTLMAFHVFIQEKVDAAIFEVGIGGSFDSTNVIDEPVVCGITSLGLDHQSILGETLAEIAWHKAGIMKASVPCISVLQKKEAAEVLLQRSKEAATKLDVIQDPEEYLNTKELGLAGQHQRQNAALAMALCQAWHERTNKPPVDINHGLKQARWPGRAQVVDNVYLDGAHTVESIQACVEWFKSQVSNDKKQVLIFNCTMGRDASKLLAPLRQIPFHQVLFVPNAAKSPDLVNNMVHKDQDLTAQHAMKEVWGPNAQVLPSIESAFEIIKDEQVLVTGSLHLLGSVMTHLDLPVQ